MACLTRTTKSKGKWRQRRSRILHWVTMTVPYFILTKVFATAFIFPSARSPFHVPCPSASIDNTKLLYMYKPSLSSINRKTAPEQIHARRKFLSLNAVSKDADKDAKVETTNNNTTRFERPPPSSVEELLRYYEYGERIITLNFRADDGSFIGENSNSTEASSKIYAEVQEGGIARVCQILRIVRGTSSKTKKGTHESTGQDRINPTRPPLLEVRFLDEGNQDKETKVIDIGQVTTIWANLNDELGERRMEKKQKPIDKIYGQVLEGLPVNHVEESFECRYKYHVSRGRSAQGMTKKQIDMISAAASIAASSNNSSYSETEELRLVIDRIMKQCVRSGSKYTRLMDSESLEEWMFYVDVEGTIMKNYTRDTTLLERRIFCAKILSEDSERAGRFKRMPCMWLPPASSTDQDSTERLSASDSMTSTPAADMTTTLTLVNGGWTVVDQSVRAANEARKFVKTAMKKSSDGAGTFAGDPNNERILCRLESLACGEKLRKQQSAGSGNGMKLEVDVRTVLETLNLPLSSEGAQEALFRMGRWTKTGPQTEDGKQYERWSPDVLKAAKWYQQMDLVRRRDMKSEILRKHSSPSKKMKKVSSSPVLEERTDLTSLPCICVDAERVSFRDDAFGIRKRSSTGRKVNKQASEWELLFHIADVSDIFSPKPTVVGSKFASVTTAEQAISIEDQKKHLRELKKAARSRIRSEYNLPLGPLHLLPTNVLSSLSLDAFKQDWTSDPKDWPTSWQNMDEKNGSVNRVVTLWVYIDERNGYILDMGFERSIISRPLALSFKMATTLLEASEMQQAKLPPMLTKARVLLSKVEQNIQRCNEYRLKTHDSARAREKKLASREFVSNQVYRGRQKRRRDDGSEGFQRSRGHRLVDSILECYEYAFRMMMRRRRALVPHHQGLNKDGRSATSPLRTYLHGLAQRQALSVLCKYGGEPMDDEQCKDVGQAIRTAYTARQHIGGAIKGAPKVSKQQLEAIRSLRFHLNNHPDSINRVVPAISTGVNSEVVIQGVGAIALCKDVPGTIARGVKVMVRIVDIDDRNGKLVVSLNSIIPRK